MAYTYKKTGIFLYSVLTLVTVAYVVMSMLFFLHLLNPAMIILLAGLSLTAPIMMLSCVAFDRYLTHRESYLAYVGLGAVLLFAGGYLSIPILFMNAHMAVFLSTASMVVGSAGCLLSDMVFLLYAVSPCFQSQSKKEGGSDIFFALASLCVSIYWIFTGAWLKLFIFSIMQCVCLSLVWMYKQDGDGILPAFIRFSESGESAPLQPPVRKMGLPLLSDEHTTAPSQLIDNDNREGDGDEAQHNDNNNDKFSV